MTSNKVHLLDITEAFNFQFDEINYYLDKRTNIVFSLTDDDIRATDSDKDIEQYPKWQRESIELAMEVEEDIDDNFIGLPSKYDINDYKIMESFCEKVKDEAIKHKLLEVLRGKGAFRKFKDIVLMNNIEQAWYQHREKSYLKIAIKWCEGNSLEYES